MLGGHKGVSFSLYAKVDISTEEQNLIDHYKVQEQILASYIVNWGAIGKKLTGEDATAINITVGGLTNGENITMESLSDLLELENSIKKGVLQLKTILEAMRDFGGERVFELEELMKEDDK